MLCIGTVAHPEDDRPVVLGTAVHAQSTRRHSLETLGNMRHQYVHTLRKPRFPRYPITPLGGLWQLPGMTGRTRAVVQRLGILCSLSAEKRQEHTDSKQPFRHAQRPFRVGGRAAF